MVERYGNRQRKCNGLETWPFRMFVESLSIMLQIALPPAGCRDPCDRSTRLLRVLSSPSPLLMSYSTRAGTVIAETW